jgi:hypothetical protein
VRDGYTLGFVNKTPRAADFELSVVGLPGAKLILSEISPKPETTATVPMPADQLRTLRVLVQAQPDHLVAGRESFDFVLRNRETGAKTTYHALFMGPVSHDR